MLTGARRDRRPFSVEKTTILLPETGATPNGLTEAQSMNALLRNKVQKQNPLGVNRSHDAPGSNCTAKLAAPGPNTPTTNQPSHPWSSRIIMTPPTANAAQRSRNSRCFVREG